MKKRLRVVAVAAVAVCLIAILLLTGCSSVKTYQLNAGERDFSDGALYAYGVMQTLASQYPNRSAGSGNDLIAAQWIADQMESLGYVPAGGKDPIAQNRGVYRFQYTYRTGEGTNQNAQSYNVVYKSEQENAAGTILFMTSYDNAYDALSADTKADGSYESGAGVGVLLALARELAAVGTPYNVVIAFLGEGEYSWTGAKEFSSNLGVEQAKQLSMAVSLDYPVGGDHLYLYGRDRATDYNSLWTAAARANGANMKDVPADKGIVEARYGEDSLTSYFHVGMLGNQIYLTNAKVPTQSLRRFNWSDRSVAGGSEYKGKENVLYTPNDTLANMIERAGGEEELILQVKDALTASIAAMLPEYEQELTQALSLAREQEINTAAQSDALGIGLMIGTKVLAVVVVLAIVMALRKKVAADPELYGKIVRYASGGNAAPQKPAEPIDVFGLDGEKRGSDDAKTGNGGSESDGKDDVFEGF